jgi:nicotinamidase-related amidase
MNPTLDPKTTALLVMDLQNGAVQMLDMGKDAVLARTATLIESARKAGVRIVYVVVGFRAGYPEVGTRNPLFASVRESGRLVEGSADVQVHATVAPKPGEVIVTKRRVSAFAGTDLDMVLRAGGIDTLILTGITTSGVVLSTVRHASDADYRLVVVEDCCADRDVEVHRTLLEKVFPRQATVSKSNEVLAALAR